GRPLAACVRCMTAGGAFPSGDLRADGRSRACGLCHTKSPLAPLSFCLRVLEADHGRHASCTFGAGLNRSLQSCSQPLVRGPERVRAWGRRQRVRPKAWLLLPPVACHRAVIAGAALACLWRPGPLPDAHIELMSRSAQLTGDDTAVAAAVTH